MRRMIDLGRLAGTLALAGGVLVLGAALAQAFRPVSAPLPEPGPAVDITGPASPQVLVASRPSVEPISDEIVRQAANRAPFDPERRPPTRRYQLPGEQAVEGTPSPVQLPPVPPLLVLGTISGLGGGIAVIQEVGGQPRVVSVGQTIGAYLLTSVQEESVTVSSGEWEFNLELGLENPAAAAGSQDNSDLNNRRGNMSQEQMQQRLETWARTMQERLGNNVRIQIEGDRAYLIRPDGTRQEVQMPGRGARGTIPPVDRPGQDDGADTGGGGD